MTYALIGSRTSRKSALYALLTGDRRPFAEDEAERRENLLRFHKQLTVAELPGIDFLTPESSAQAYTRDYLLIGRPDGMVHLVRADALREGLRLTLELLELGTPMILAIDGIDPEQGINLEVLRGALGIPVVAVDVAEEDVEELVQLMDEGAGTAAGCQVYTPDAERALQSIEGLIMHDILAVGLPPRFAVVRLIEGDLAITRLLALPQSESVLVRRIISGLEQPLEIPLGTALGEMRCEFVDSILGRARDGTGSPVRPRPPSHLLLADWVVALPLFALMMLGIFWVSLGPIGGGMGRLVAEFFDWSRAWLAYAMRGLEWNPVLISLWTDGLLGTLGGFLSLAPQVLLLQGAIALLDASGVIARLSYLLDPPLRRLGLSGAAVGPMLLGFGCGVPAILAMSRTGRRGRRLATAILPFFLCSGKLTVFAMLIHLLMPARAPLWMFLFYLGGVATGLLTAFLYKTLTRARLAAPIMTVSPIHRPDSAQIRGRLSRSAHDFLLDALPLVLAAGMLVWLLGSFDLTLAPAAAGESILARIGNLLAPLLSPIGLGDWRAAALLLAALLAKETVPGTLGALAGTAGAAALVAELFTPLSACAFMTLLLFLNPCVAGMVATGRAVKSFRMTAAVLFYQLLIGWTAAFAVYQLGSLLL